MVDPGLSCVVSEGDASGSWRPCLAWALWRGLGNGIPLGGFGALVWGELFSGNAATDELRQAFAAETHKQ